MLLITARGALVSVIADACLQASGVVWVRDPQPRVKRLVRRIPQRLAVSVPQCLPAVCVSSPSCVHLLGSRSRVLSDVPAAPSTQILLGDLRALTVHH